MPQMAPLLWLYLYFFFLVSFINFISMNYFIKPFEATDSSSVSKTPLQQLNWKL